MNVSYSPVCLPASDRIEYMRNALLKWSVHSNTPDYPSPSLVAQGTRMHFDDLDLLMSRFEEAGRRINQRWRWNASIGLEVVLKRLASLDFGSSERLSGVASARLEKVMSGEGLLSSDQAHARALADTLGRLEGFRRDLNNGAFA